MPADPSAPGPPPTSALQTGALLKTGAPPPPPAGPAAALALALVYAPSLGPCCVPVDPGRYGRRHFPYQQTLEVALSGEHFEVALDPLRVRDLGSTHGLWRNGVRLGMDWVALEAGDALRAGDRVFGVAPAVQPAAQTRHGVVFADPATAAALDALALAAKAGGHVLLYGETGAGKEVFAQAFKELLGIGPYEIAGGHVSGGDPKWFETQLFGNAREKVVGKAERAHGGVLFLDEIGELSAEAQASLLRFLEDGSFEPLGSAKTRKVKVRVVAATNRDLDLAVRQGSFRRDLRARLASHVALPPLRERRADIAPLARHFDARSSLSPAALGLLQRLWLPQNARDLRNLVHSARARAGADAIEPAHLFVHDALGATYPDRAAAVEALIRPPHPQMPAPAPTAVVIAAPAPPPAPPPAARTAPQDLFDYLRRIRACGYVWARVEDSLPPGRRRQHYNQHYFGEDQAQIRANLAARLLAPEDTRALEDYCATLRSGGRGIVNPLSQAEIDVLIATLRAQLT